MRRAARVDANQTQIVEAVRDAGMHWLHMHSLGRGKPDGTLGISGHNLLIEIKTDGGELTSKEAEFHCTWPGPLHIVRSPEEAIQVAYGYRRRDESVRYALRMVRRYLVNHRYGGTGGLLMLVEEALEALG